MQLRVNAEDPWSGFAPSVGRINGLRLPTGPFVRVDTALFEGAEVTPYYDSLLAKLIVWGRDRDEALDIVQGAMLRLARSYAGRPSEEWKPLFYRILYNGIRDSQRRRKVRSRIFGFFPGQWQRDDGQGGEAQAQGGQHVAARMGAQRVEPA